MEYLRSLDLLRGRRDNMDGLGAVIPSSFSLPLDRLRVTFLRTTEAGTTLDIPSSWFPWFQLPTGTAVGVDSKLSPAVFGAQARTGDPEASTVDIPWSWFNSRILAAVLCSCAVLWILRTCSSRGERELLCAETHPGEHCLLPLPCVELSARPSICWDVSPLFAMIRTKAKERTHTATETTSSNKLRWELF